LPSGGGGGTFLPRRRLPALAESTRERQTAWVSDGTLRELERKFRETGSVEDEAAWLRARVQTGDLEQERLEFAAQCGHAAALAALPTSSAWTPPKHEPFDSPALQAEMTAVGWWEGQTAEAWAYRVADQGKEASLLATRALLGQGLCSSVDVQVIDGLDADWPEGCHEFLGRIFCVAGEAHGAGAVLDATRAPLVEWTLRSPRD